MMRAFAAIQAEQAELCASLKLYSTYTGENGSSWTGAPNARAARVMLAESDDAAERKKKKKGTAGDSKRVIRKGTRPEHGPESFNVPFSPSPVRSSSWRKVDNGGEKVSLGHSGKTDGLYFARVFDETDQVAREAHKAAGIVEGEDPWDPRDAANMRGRIFHVLPCYNMVYNIVCGLYMGDQDNRFLQWMEGEGMSHEEFLRVPRGLQDSIIQLAYQRQPSLQLALLHQDGRDIVASYNDSDPLGGRLTKKEVEAEVGTLKRKLGFGQEGKGEGGVGASTKRQKTLEFEITKDPVCTHDENAADGIFVREYAFCGAKEIPEDWIAFAKREDERKANGEGSSAAASVSVSVSERVE